MSQCVPSWDLDDVNHNLDVSKLDYEVAELTWENGQLAMHGLAPRRVPNKPQSTTSTLPKYTWDKPRAAETLEAIVDQATLQPYHKTQVAVTGDELVPWLHHHNANVAAASVNASATMTTDALVPSSNNRIDETSAQALRSMKSVREAGCSTLVGSCSGDPSAFSDRRVAGGGAMAGAARDGSSCRDQSVGASATFGRVDTCDRDLGGRGLTSTSTASPENTSSGEQYTKSTSPDDSVCHCRLQREANEVKERKKEKGKSSISTKRRRTSAIHNQSERRRRDKINQRMKTLQKLVPNSSKTDKASMLDEVIEYLKQLQAQLQMMSRMNMSPMMMSLAMQQQMQMPMMNSMGMGMMNPMGMGMGVMDLNTIGRSNIPSGFHPSAFMCMPSWDGSAADRVANATTLAADPMAAFLACQSQPTTMDAYSRMAAFLHQMQNQSCGPLPKN